MKHRTWKIAVAAVCILALTLSLGAAAFAADADAAFRYTAGPEGLTLTAYTGSASNLTIPAEIDGQPVIAIGDECFQGKICLKRVHVPEGVRRLGDYAFEACGALQRVYLPDSLAEIGDGTFSGCANLTLADLQDGVERIGAGAFLCCDSLVSLELSAALKELGEFAFAGCGNLVRVTFAGDALTAIPDRAFYGCESLSRIRLPETVTAIGKRAFSGCAALQSFYHGTPLESLGAYAFEGCERMVGWSAVASAIPEGTFSGCGAMSYLRLEDGVKRVESMAFSGASVTDLSLSAGVTELEPGAFYGSNLRSVTVEEGNPAYQNRDGSVLTADGKTLLAWMPEDPYAEQPQTEYTVPEGVEIIASFAFAQCPLTAIRLPESLREIRAYAFAETSVEDMPIPEGVTVDPRAFAAPGDPEESGASPLSLRAGAESGFVVETHSLAGDKSLYREEDFRDYLTVQNADFDAWCEEYLAWNEAQGNPIREDLIPYIMRYKGEVVPHFMAMTAVQNHDPEMWANAANFFGDDFERQYLMMNHGLFTELRRGRMQDNLILYSGVYDSQLMAAAGSDTVPTQDQLIDAIGNVFSDSVMISTTTDPAVACGFGDTLFLIYASREAMEALGAVCMDAVVHSSEKEILMTAHASYRLLDVGDMTVTHQDPWDDAPVTEERHYVRVALLGPDTPSNPFEDVTKDMFCYDAVLWAAKAGITNGLTPTRFAPDSGATRGQMVTFLWRAAGTPVPETGACRFVDVPEDAYYRDAVLWAAETGITNGVDATHFSPDKLCSRGEFVTLLYRFLDSPKHGDENRFEDVSTADYYYDAVLWAAETGVTNGVDATHFSPAKLCTRGETVTLLYRAVGA